MSIFNFWKKDSKPEEITITNDVGEVLEQSVCMWKPTPEDPDFTKSKVVKLIGELFDIFDGVELHAFNTFSMSRQGERLDEMPEKEVFLTTRVKKQGVLISLSKEKGLRFRFDYKKSTVSEIVLALEYIKGVFGDNPEKLHEPTEGKNWWKMMKKNFQNMDGDREITAVGIYPGYIKFPG